uniref:DUF393 domain-containing protein n=1 Tax=Trypanosoma congolense (strain IL3000) TaxID=1068625 RepID=G0UV79_TRYCI|nr:conserved hypothetical protein [Trypanosoma congolense IL3000]
MSYRYNGRACASILHKLPKNLVVFDGHCRMCQARVQYVLERNFSYFSLLNPFKDADKVKLEENKMLFCSFDSIEWRELSRHFPHITKDVQGIVLIEKVPSHNARFLSSVRRRKIHNGASTGTQWSTNFPVASTSGFRDPNVPESEVDVLVSIKHSAVCRVGMKLDRWLPSTVARCMFYLLPYCVGNLWFDYMLRRRRLWGTTEEDAIRSPTCVMGLKERTWRLRHR